MIAKYHFINFVQRPMYPCTKKRNVFSGTEWVTHGSVKIHSLVEAGKIRQQVPRERRLHSRFAYRNENAGLLDPACNPWSVKAKARLVIQGQDCPDNAQGLVRTGAPTVHRTAVSVFFQLVSSMGWCRSLKRMWMLLVPFCEDNLEKPKSFCSSSRLHVAYLESRKVP